MELLQAKQLIGMKITEIEIVRAPEWTETATWLTPGIMTATGILVQGALFNFQISYEWNIGERDKAYLRIILGYLTTKLDLSLVTNFIVKDNFITEHLNNL